MFIQVVQYALMVKIVGTYYEQEGHREVGRVRFRLLIQAPRNNRGLLGAKLGGDPPQGYSLIQRAKKTYPLYLMGDIQQFVSQILAPLGWIILQSH